MGERRCRTNEPSRGLARTNAKARRRPLRRASSCARRSIRFAMANTGRDRRSRPSPSASPRRDARALICLRRVRAASRSAPAGAPNTPTKRASTSAKLTAVRASRAPYRGCSSASRAARCRAGRFRAKPRGPPPGAALPRVPPPRAKRRAPRAEPAARPQHAKPRGLGHAVAGSAARIGRRQSAARRRAFTHAARMLWSMRLQRTKVG
jgi:hypothetical protein